MDALITYLITTQILEVIEMKALRRIVNKRRMDRITKIFGKSAKFKESAHGSEEEWSGKCTY